MHGTRPQAITSEMHHMQRNHMEILVGIKPTVQRPIAIHVNRM